MKDIIERYQESIDIVNIAFYFFLIKAIIIFIVAMAIRNNTAIIYAIWCFILAIIMKLYEIEIALSWIVRKLDRRKENDNR